MQKKKSKRERKMNADELQNLLHFRKRGYVQKDKTKNIPRKAKHKGGDYK